MYESSSELKLDVETNASELGITALGDNSNLNVISGEIELIRSKLFFNKVIDNVNLQISYFTTGNILNDEKYGNAPFFVDYKLENGAIFDRPIYIDIIDKSKFSLSFFDEGMTNAVTYNFGEKISFQNNVLSIYLTEHYKPNQTSKHFFILNSRNAQINYLQANLTVQPLNLNANTIKISFRDFNQFKARDLVNAIDSLYLAYSQEEKNLENTKKITWLNQELNEIEKQLESYEDYFETFTIENRTSDLDKDLNKTIVAINLLDSQRYTLTQKIRATEVILNAVKSENSLGDLGVADQIAVEGYSSNATATFKDLQRLKKERERLLLSYERSTLAVTQKDQEIAGLQSDLEYQLTSLIKSYTATKRDIEKRKGQLQKDFVTLPEKSTELNKNRRFFKLYEEFYLSLMQSKAEFQIAQAGTTTSFKILSNATLPSAPISPKKLIVYGIGLFAGIILCLGFVGVRYVLHNKITTTQELERYITAPVLGSIPQASEKLSVTSLIMDKKPKSALSESLRSIRTNIQFMIDLGSSKVISVTSTISGEGKTFVAVNLGGIIALTGKRVIILDLDMRKPKVHLAFDAEQTDKGMSTVLINKHEGKDCICKTRLENLDYIPAGPTPPNPSELLLNPIFDNLVSCLKDEYDIIILDTPPVGLVTDGILAMKKADLGIYIVRSNFSKRIFLKTLDKLVNVNHFDNLSVVLNAVPNVVGKGYGYGYGYGYYDEKG